MTTHRLRLAHFIARLIAGRHALAVSATVNDSSSGWASLTGRPHDRDAGEQLQLYWDALEAWRKNPIAKRITDVISDYTIGDGLQPEAPGDLGRFVTKWWRHPLNNMALRLPDVVDELTRAGDVFPTLHTNPTDGMSYVRLVPKDLISAIITADNDWETELAYHESALSPDASIASPRVWLSPAHPDAADAPAVMLHYAINRPVGALFGESDLATILPWLLRYSHMLEDRVRLHWALRAFLWVVTVPAHMVAAKQAQYAIPPESGSIIVKDDAEVWDTHAPGVNAADASHDMHAVRMMIDAGSAVPPHWRGEPTDLNLATARAMQDPAVRHLRRRQLHISHLVRDLAYQAARRAYALGRLRNRPAFEAITVSLPDISRDDDAILALAARDLSQALQTATTTLGGRSDTWSTLLLDLILKFAGQPQPAGTLATIIAEAAANPTPTPTPTPTPADNTPRARPVPANGNRP